MVSLTPICTKLSTLGQEVKATPLHKCSCASALLPRERRSRPWTRTTSLRLGTIEGRDRQEAGFRPELKRIGAESGATVLLAPVKSLGRAFAKVHEKYGGRYDGLTDLVRGTLQCDSLEVVQSKCVRALAQSHQFKVSRVKNRLDPSYIASDGYRDVLCNVEIGDGCIAEVQVNLASMVDSKNRRATRATRRRRMIHFADNTNHVSSAAGWASRAAARCPADEMRPLCLAERVSTGQLTQLSQSRRLGAVPGPRRA